MRIELNGEPRELDDGASLAEAVRLAGADPQQRGIAVAVEGEIVPRSEWVEARLAEGARVEVVRATQGG